MTYVKNGSLLTDLIAATGLQIAFYYGLTGLASAWYFHRAATWRDRLVKVLLPLLGGLILLGAGIYSAAQMWNPANDIGGVTIWGVGGTFILGIGAVALGIPLMIAWNLTSDGRAYFAGSTMATVGSLLAASDAEAH
jgi:hypothetical protein